IAEVDKKIDEFTQSKDVFEAIENQWLFHWLQPDGMTDPGTLKTARDEFSKRWADPKWRRRCCSGKRVLAYMRWWLQEEWKISLSNNRLFAAFKPDEELKKLFDTLEAHIIAATNKPPQTAAGSAGEAHTAGQSPEVPIPQKPEA